jgi:aerobic-type carbon monoxide dehydrogenase small subunit (CoxS/CutS family)
MSEKTAITVNINGRDHAIAVEPRRTLADAIREDCGQTGTHIGCEHGVCGACTVIVDGAAVRGCLTLAVQVEGRDVTTVEGLGSAAHLGALQLAFRRHHALQCGFCTAGILTTAHALLTDEPNASEERIREVISGNLCRCTGYLPIVAAVMEARAAYGVRQCEATQ